MEPWNQHCRGQCSCITLRSPDYIILIDHLLWRSRYSAPHHRVSISPTHGLKKTTHLEGSLKCLFQPLRWWASKKNAKSNFYTLLTRTKLGTRVESCCCCLFRKFWLIHVKEFEIYPEANVCNFYLFFMHTGYNCKCNNFSQGNQHDCGGGYIRYQ